nr:hypothetical protein [Nocardia bovistercoris]
MLLAGCGDDSSTSSSPASSSTAKAAGNAAQVVDSTKAGTFVVSFKAAFPKLAQGRTDAQISDILSQTCTDRKAGKAEDAAVTALVGRLKNGSTEATKEEAQAIYAMAQMMCG